MSAVRPLYNSRTEIISVDLVKRDELRLCGARTVVHEALVCALVDRGGVEDRSPSVRSRASPPSWARPFSRSRERKYLESRDERSA